MSKKNDDPIILELTQRISRLEADVSWLKKMASTNMIITLGTFLTLIVMLLRLIGG